MDPSNSLPRERSKASPSGTVRTCECIGGHAELLSIITLMLPSSPSSRGCAVLSDDMIYCQIAKTNGSGSNVLAFVVVSSCMYYLSFSEPHYEHSRMYCLPSFGRKISTSYGKLQSHPTMFWSDQPQPRMICDVCSTPVTQNVAACAV